MVRNMAGALLEAGKGNLQSGDILTRLEPGSRCKPASSAPASGLFLVLVEYE
ncbi:MAG: hypothetical protein ACREHV_14600 [Rhizomicrobium sp.]